MFDNEKELLFLDDVKRITGLSKPVIVKLIQSGDIRAMKMGRRWVIAKEWLTDYVNQI